MFVRFLRIVAVLSFRSRPILGSPRVWSCVTERYEVTLHILFLVISDKLLHVKDNEKACANFCWISILFKIKVFFLGHEPRNTAGVGSRVTYCCWLGWRLLKVENHWHIASCNENKLFTRKYLVISYDILNATGTEFVEKGMLKTLWQCEENLKSSNFEPKEI